MKNILLKIVSIALLIGSISSCQELTKPEAKDFDKFGKTDEYYAQLRAYKKTDHPVAFGWFGNWTGKGASFVNSLAGLPDSVDFISLWGGWKSPTADKLKDLRFVQQVKGTRALMVFIISNIGDQLTPSQYTTDRASINAYWGWKDGDSAAIKSAVEKYAAVICDTIDKYSYDGFDIDWEPNFGGSGNISQSGSANNKDGSPADFLVKALSKRLGPASGTGKLLVVDGEPQSMPPSTGPLFDWFLVQAYNCSGDANLDSRLATTIARYTGVLTAQQVAKKYITTENFESYSSTGGNKSYKDRKSVTMNSLQGMARWIPIINGDSVPKGGIGTYHMEYEYTLAGKSGTYPYLRQGMLIMNPPGKVNINDAIRKK